MCLAVPGKLVAIEADADGLLMGTVDFGGIQKRACLAYIPDAKVGEWFIVHVGFALSRIDEAEAKRVFAMLEEMNELGEPEGP